MGIFKCIVDYKIGNKIPPNLKGIGRDEFISRTFGELWRLYRARGGLLTFEEFMYLHLRTVREFIRNANGNLSTRYKSIETFIDKWLENNEYKHAWKFREYLQHLETKEFRELKKTVSELPTLKQRIEFSYSYANAYLYAQHMGKLDADRILEVERKYLGWAEKTFSSLTFWLLFSAGLHIEKWLSDVYVASRSVEVLKDAYSDNLVIKKVYEFDKSEGIFDKFQRDFLNWDTAKSIVINAVSEVFANELAAVFQKSLATFMIYLARGAWLLANFIPQFRVLNLGVRALIALAHIVERSFLVRLATWVGIEWQLDAWMQTSLSNITKSLKLFPDEFGGLLKAEWSELFDYTMRSIFAPETLQRWQLEVIEEYQKRMTSEAKAFYASSIIQYETLGRIRGLRYLYNNAEVQKTLGLSEKDVNRLNKILTTLEWEVRSAFAPEEPKSVVEQAFSFIEGIVKGRKEDEEERLKKLELLKKIRDKLKEGQEKLRQKMIEAKRDEWAKQQGIPKPRSTMKTYVEEVFIRRQFPETTEIRIYFPSMHHFDVKWLKENFELLKDLSDSWLSDGYVIALKPDKETFWLKHIATIEELICPPPYTICLGIEYYAEYEQLWKYVAYAEKAAGKMFDRNDIIQLIYQGFQIEMRNAKAIKDSPFAYLTLVKKENALRIAFRGNCAIIERAKHRIRKLINALEPLEVEKHFIVLEGYNFLGGDWIVL